MMEDLVSMLEEEVGSAEVRVVRLVVGLESCASVDALQQCFRVCATGTALEKATLDIVRTPGSDLKLREIEVSDVR